MRVPAVLADADVVARRNIIKIKRVPDLLVFTTLQPIMFVLLFSYVFGGAIGSALGGAGGAGGAPPEVPMAGGFAPTAVFGAPRTRPAAGEGGQKGVIDRFRSLPMAPSAVLTGRTFSDMVNNVVVLVVMSLTGLAVGWRIRSSFLDAVLGYLVLLAFAYAVSWIMAFVGMLVNSPEVFNNASFIVIFPLTFIAITFVPLDTLPAPLQRFAEWNPVSSVTQAAREQFGNVLPGTPEPTAWPLQNPVLYTLIWALLILAVFVPLANAQYRRSTSR